MDERGLVRQAIRAREQSYSPYSGFMVGAALLTEAGNIYLGCNIENAAYTPTICAERTAFAKAVSEGERDFAAIAIAGWPKNGEADLGYPCGVCRQVMMEFCKPAHFRIIIAASGDSYRVHTLQELLPYGFGPSNLQLPKLPTEDVSCH